MSVEDIDKRTLAEPDGPPLIFPLPSPTFQHFAYGGGYILAWYPPKKHEPVQFIIFHDNLLRRKQLAAFPLTEEGWASAWQYIRDHAPKLVDPVRRELAQIRIRMETAEQAEIRRRPLFGPRLIKACSVVLVGGFGYAIELVDKKCWLYWGEDALRIAPAGASAPAMVLEYPGMREVEFSGPGKVRNGMVFMGGGFGIQGALKGAIEADILTRLLSRVRIETMLRVASSDYEMFFACDSDTPQALRIALSEPLSRLGGAKDQDLSSEENSSMVPSGRSLPDELRKLGELFDQGLLTTEEFATAKARLLSDG